MTKGGARPTEATNITPPALNDLKRRVYTFAIAFVAPALMLWWAFTERVDTQNLFLRLALPALSLYLLWTLSHMRRHPDLAWLERRNIKVICAFLVGTVLAKLVWPPPPSLRGLEDTLLIVVALCAYLMLPLRQAIATSAALFAVVALGSWLELWRAGLVGELWLITLLRQTGTLAVMGMLSLLAWIQFLWGESAAVTARWRDLAFSDPLTELPNRRGMYVAVEAAIAGAPHTPFCVVLTDIDDFKAVNDRWGHETGDRVLGEVAALLRRGVRRGDAAGRWGGEEFLIVLSDTTLDDARRQAERLRERMPDLRGVPPVTASFGVACWRERDTFEALLRRADAALYRAKRGGKNRVVAEDEREPEAVA